ncbi:hypothetical protein TGVAND_366360 [Toxoplasma gondii VAND]|uniref:Uncharacterized protein n=1 Tax=Toxoplasma gondii VAND TaxID=933077 RepID=A0A086PVM5_TOXGO|nr:hypothetical protein TGVAND_366360 [Toxoplasma gondii VAND]
MHMTRSEDTAQQGEETQTDQTGRGPGRGEKEENGRGRKRETDTHMTHMRAVLTRTSLKDGGSWKESATKRTETAKKTARGKPEGRRRQRHERERDKTPTAQRNAKTGEETRQRSDSTNRKRLSKNENLQTCKRRTHL